MVKGKLRQARKRGATERGASERGAADVFMLMLMALLIAFAGLTFDVGMAFNARREATNIATAAARAGANAVSTDALYQDGLAEIDPGLALSAAAAAIPADASRTGWRIEDNSELWIKIEMVHDTSILRIIGINQFTVSGEGIARVQNGPDA